ncbi:substrate-binding domain-containing protein [Haloterrigena alkaliphila]|uniref:Substrate-binding domain-containing protein n=1 Tax=Haloterrigena alkaliphila TaxID=2816475 RepID=A0A8A2VDD0_9EURY|nr:substrate-binding domain-containing protein [Haloterrigena alkaliphila]QSW99236.1 substrate-binding domain-containing protein [Haloterrigena alkaliphila]
MTIQRREFVAALATGSVAGLAGCASLTSDSDGGSITGETLTLTTTSSTYNTGLLDELNAPFEDRYGVTVDAVSQGTGQALETARNGDSDVVMVHARSLEDEFMREGYGVNRRDLMYNDFVVVGGPDDPAGIGGGEDVVASFEAIAESESAFVSRGDDSGTHTKELELWDETGLAVEEFGDWYAEVGAGMGDALNRATQLDAYTLSDRGTYLDMQDELDLEIHVQGPIEGGAELLANPYGIVAVNPAVHDHVEYDLAMAYIGFITGPEGQELIENYTANGEQLFYPEALSEDPNFRQYVPEGWNGADGGESNDSSDG